MENLRQEFNNSIILVCGGAGFIGSNFIRHIFSNHPKAKIINLDKLTYAGNTDNLKDISGKNNYIFHKGDIAKNKTVFEIIKRYKPKFIINFAAETHVDKSIHQDSRTFVESNITGVFNILEAVRQLGNVEKFVQISTDEVYGSLNLDSQKKCSENDIFCPNSPYAASKASGDLLCRAYFKTWNVPVVVTHSSNNYGSYQYPEKLIPFFIHRILENKKVPLYGDGQNVRDWLYVLDHCRALELCLLRGSSGERYNIGANNEKSNLEIAKFILKYLGKDESYIEFVADRPGHDLRYGLDTVKIQNQLNWQPKFDFAQSLRETINWYINNRHWVEKIKRKVKIFNPHIFR